MLRHAHRDALTHTEPDLVAHPPLLPEPGQNLTTVGGFSELEFRETEKSV